MIFKKVQKFKSLKNHYGQSKLWTICICGLVDSGVTASLTPLNYIFLFCYELSWNQLVIKTSFTVHTILYMSLNTKQMRPKTVEIFINGAKPQTLTV